ncbi:hypothetical protein GOP47_0022029 [Adiantum capillus-veneris]|uniref:Uncharacterized protein n=1 Tax=Adiantum capillus-veneris TaxID=13818 RepID=A0A9D4U8Y9_ADICA|nr:hypothetical protein GOP47_0022029 [Adiantum capillus-veneris]
MEKMGLMTRAQKPSPEDGGKSLNKPDPLVQYVFTLSPSAIKKLKSEACEGFTSFEVTCMHFWKRTSSTRKSPPDESTFVFVAINCHSRISLLVSDLRNEEANGVRSIVAILKDLLAEGEKLVHPDLMVEYMLLQLHHEGDGCELMFYVNVKTVLPICHQLVKVMSSSAPGVNSESKAMKHWDRAPHPVGLVFLSCCQLKFCDYVACLNADQAN